MTPIASKPQNSSGNGEYVQRNYPVPKSGPRRARISLIVDLGIQPREDFDIGKPTQKPQKPAQQIAMFADLVNDVVDYGGDIGKAHYRLLINNTYMGKLKGINFYPTPPKDADGNTIKGKEWGLHDNSVITKLGKAIGKPEVQLPPMDVSILLGGQFMADVEVNEKASGKMDADGEEIIYKNVNYKSCAKVAPVIKEDADGNEVEEVPTFAALKMEPKCISFDNATKDDIKVIRANLIQIIKQATNYAGSQMQKAIEAYEAENGGNAAPAKDAVAPAVKPKATPKTKAPVEQDMADDDVPF